LLNSKNDDVNAYKQLLLDAQLFAPDILDLLVRIDLVDD
jgi:hypothetical protein